MGARGRLHLGQVATLGVTCTWEHLDWAPAGHRVNIGTVRWWALVATCTCQLRPGGMAPVGTFLSISNLAETVDTSVTIARALPKVLRKGPGGDARGHLRLVCKDTGIRERRAAGMGKCRQ